MLRIAYLWYFGPYNWIYAYFYINYDANQFFASVQHAAGVFFMGMFFLFLNCMTLNIIFIMKYLCLFIRNQEFSLLSKALISVLLRTSNTTLTNTTSHTSTAGTQRTTTITTTAMTTKSTRKKCSRHHIERVSNKQ